MDAQLIAVYVTNGGATHGVIALVVTLQLHADVNGVRHTKLCQNTPRNKRNDRLLIELSVAEQKICIRAL